MQPLVNIFHNLLIRLKYFILWLIVLLYYHRLIINCACFVICNRVAVCCKYILRLGLRGRSQWIRLSTYLCQSIHLILLNLLLLLLKLLRWVWLRIWLLYSLLHISIILLKYLTIYLHIIFYTLILLSNKFTIILLLWWYNLFIDVIIIIPDFFILVRDKRINIGQIASHIRGWNKWTIINLWLLLSGNNEGIWSMRLNLLVLWRRRSILVPHLRRW